MLFGTNTEKFPKYTHITDNNCVAEPYSKSLFHLCFSFRISEVSKSNDQAESHTFTKESRRFWIDNQRTFTEFQAGSKPTV